MVTNAARSPDHRCTKSHIGTRQVDRVSTCVIFVYDANIIFTRPMFDNTGKKTQKRNGIFFFIENDKVFYSESGFLNLNVIFTNSDEGGACGASLTVHGGIYDVTIYIYISDRPCMIQILNRF